MKDRIEVNGVWYIKENTIVQPTISQLEPGTKYDGMVFESDLYVFDCTRVYDEDGNLYKDGNVSVKFTDKSITHDIDKFQEHWDNVDWMNGVLDGDEGSIETAMESLCTRGLIELKEVLTTLSVAAWL